ncbi:MAG: 30S ribosomal protein S3 [Anaerolineales bacterium]
MGRKVHPIGFRLKINKTWDGRWYAEGEDYVNMLHQDFAIRDMIREHASRAGVSRIEIERFPGKVKIYVHSAKPGILIGRKGENIKKLRKHLEALVGQRIDLDIKEIKYPDLDAYLVSRNIASQLERRIGYRRAIKRAIQQAMRQGAKGIKIEVAGRLGGADMARRMWLREGRVPLQTLRSDIDYAQTDAFTTYSAIGVKVWIYKGDVLSEKEEKIEPTQGVYVSK